MRERRHDLTPAQLEPRTRDPPTSSTRSSPRAAHPSPATCPRRPNRHAPFINAGWNEVRILLPISRDDGLLDWTVADPEGDEIDTALGVPEAVGEVLGPIAVGEVDLMIVPASAVDEDGWRMGWGRGYYDRTLGSMDQRLPVYAVIYDSEVVERVPREVHDQPVTGAVTPTRTITFAR